MNASQVIRFFQSWGLDAEDDGASVSPKVYAKLLNEAQRVGGNELLTLCASLIDATDNEFYLNVTTWDEVAQAWGYE
jgi:hypothetical protein